MMPRLRLLLMLASVVVCTILLVNHYGATEQQAGSTDHQEYQSARSGGTSGEKRENRSATGPLTRSDESAVGAKPAPALRANPLKDVPPDYPFVPTEPLPEPKIMLSSAEPAKRVQAKLQKVFKDILTRDLSESEVGQVLAAAKSELLQAEAGFQLYAEAIAGFSRASRADEFWNGFSSYKEAQDEAVRRFANPNKGRDLCRIVRFRYASSGDGRHRLVVADPHDHLDLYKTYSETLSLCDVLHEKLLRELILIMASDR